MRFFFCSIIVLVFVFQAKAEVGCRVPDGRVFYGLLYLEGQLRSDCSGSPNDTQPYARVSGLANGGATCVVVINILNSLTGTQVNFDIVNCPIDDYVWLLAIPIIGLVTFRIRNKQLIA